MMNILNNSEYLKEMARQHTCRALVGTTARTFDSEGKRYVLPGDDGSTPLPCTGCQRSGLREAGDQAAG